MRPPKEYSSASGNKIATNKKTTASKRIRRRLEDECDAAGDRERSLKDFIIPPPPPSQFKDHFSRLSNKTTLSRSTTSGSTTSCSEISTVISATVSRRLPPSNNAIKSIHKIKLTESDHALAKKTESEDKMMRIDPDVEKLYDIGRRLGKGAYGVVWSAKEKKSGRQVALKKIYEAFRNTMDSQRTYREIIFLKAFGHHPHIISVIGAHKAANKLDLYLVFPLMEFDLYKLIEKDPNVLTDDNVRHVAYQLALGLHYLHSAEVIHRDLKPANILMDSNLCVKLADLGLSRTLPTSEQCQNMSSLSYDNLNWENVSPELTDYVATRWYRPPEVIISSRTYSKSMDMWAFGCILGEMLLKEVLFAGETAQHQMELIMKTIEPPTEAEIKEIGKNVNKKNMELIRLPLNKEARNSLSEIFANFDCATVDIMERLLSFSPEARLKVEDVLRHPFFVELRDSRRETPAPGPFQPPLSDNVKLEIADYQETIYAMIDHNQVISDSIPYAPNNSAHSEFKEKVHHQKIHNNANKLQTILEPEDDDSTEEEFHDDDDVLELQGETRNASYLTTNATFGDEDFEFDEINENLELHSTLKLGQKMTNNLSKSETKLANDEIEGFRKKAQIGKSLSDTTTTKFPQNSEKQPKNISILTIPSSAQKVNEYENTDIYKRFESLCMKHDLNVDEFDVGDFTKKSKALVGKNNSKISKDDDDSKKYDSSRHYEYLSNSTIQQVIKGKVANNLDDFDDCDYGDDMKRITNTMAKNKTTTSKRFLNPYEPKGRKTTCSISTATSPISQDEVENDDKLYDELAFSDDDVDFVQNIANHSQLKRIDKSFTHQKSRSILDNPSNYSNIQSIDEFLNENPLKGLSSAGQRIRGDERSFNKSQADYEAFPCKESFQNRIREIESKTKNKVSLSRNESVNKKIYYSENGGSERLQKRSDKSKIGNGKVENEDSIRQKLPTEYAKTKFSFNPYSKIEGDLGNKAPQAQRRPFGGRSYNKSFTGPSFNKKGQMQSYSDTESISRTRTHQDAQKLPNVSHSAYFPNRPRLHVPKNNRVASESNYKFGTSSSSRDMYHLRNVPIMLKDNNYRYPSLATDSHLNSGNSVTIRASDLISLKSNLPLSRGSGLSGMDRKYL